MAKESWVVYQQQMCAGELGTTTLEDDTRGFLCYSKQNLQQYTTIYVKSMG